MRFFLSRLICEKRSALAGLKTRVRFVNHINTTLATHNAAVFIAQLRRLQGISNLHNQASLRLYNSNEALSTSKMVAGRGKATGGRKIRISVPAVNSLGHFFTSAQREIGISANSDYSKTTGRKTNAPLRPELHVSPPVTDHLFSVRADRHSIQAKPAFCIVRKHL